MSGISVCYPFLIVNRLIVVSGDQQPHFNLLSVPIILIQLCQSKPIMHHSHQKPFHASGTSLRLFWMSAHSFPMTKCFIIWPAWMWQLGVNTVDDKLCCVVEVHRSVLSYLNWQAASAAIWLNSHTSILVWESWQEDACELLRAMSAPYPLWREILWQPGQPGVLYESLDRLYPFWNVVFLRQLNTQGQWVATGEVRKKQKGNVRIQ